MTYRFRVVLILTVATVFGWPGTGCMRSVGGPDGKQKSGTPRGPRASSVAAASTASSARSGSVLSVNGEIVQAQDLWDGLHDELREQASAQPPEAFRNYVERRAAQLITDHVAELVLYQHARGAMPKDGDDKVDAFVDAEVRRIVTLQFDGAQRSYEAHLESQGQTLEDARNALRRDLIVRSFVEQDIRPKLEEPTRAELQAEFQRQADAFRKPSRRRMSLIDVRVAEHLPAGTNAPTAEQLTAARAEARSQAQAALNELRSGGEFAAVAAQYSHGLHADEGGEWGWVTPGSVRARFEPAMKALYALPEGAISNVVETEDGFFVVRCDEVDPGVEPDFQSLQPELTDRFFRQKFNRAIAELIDELRAKADIQPADARAFHDAVVQAAIDILAAPGPK